VFDGSLSLLQAAGLKHLWQQTDMQAVLWVVRYFESCQQMIALQAHPQQGLPGQPITIASLLGCGEYSSKISYNSWACGTEDRSHMHLGAISKLSPSRTTSSAPLTCAFELTVEQSGRSPWLAKQQLLLGKLRWASMCCTHWPWG